jgi:5-methylcytosine-specific restriction protein A
MANGIPDGIGREHILAALDDLETGVEHLFGDSTRYDLLHDGRRYPPKAVVGLAAGKLLGSPLGPYDFKGGLKSRCFRVLQDNEFEIVSKQNMGVFPNEVEPDEPHVEGAVSQVLVNRYERDSKAREKCIRHHGARCQVCWFDFEATYGPIGDGFIHVHHLIELSKIGQAYEVDPINDLKPVCPNCHAMLHRRTPPYSLEELRDIRQDAAKRNLLPTL